ncbi:MAG TPA: hypothetical protein VIM69_10460 [Opitutaceae bacterium]
MTDLTTPALQGTVIDMSELFRRDPLSYSKQDIEVIVARFRESRKQFELGNKRAGSTKPLTAKQKEVEALGNKLNLDIDL